MSTHSNKYLLATFTERYSTRIEIRGWIFRGRRFMDVRKWFLKDGRWHPTREGIIIREHEFVRMKEAVELAAGIPVGENAR
ncbi:MAG TPA: transcriptional coactivator p15/PC4 family protein [bacterium]|nr:transcriptional coactivator p15/PC4 family protein [bacterium]HQL64050.1 transcriptional coactivator p15/PC4 family protein [bacterium]